MNFRSYTQCAYVINDIFRFYQLSIFRKRERPLNVKIIFIFLRLFFVSLIYF